MCDVSNKDGNSGCCPSHVITAIGFSGAIKKTFNGIPNL